MANRSIDFFDDQFRRQIGARDFSLNPFEHAALPFLKGRVLDLGCGLGNLAIAAARNGARNIQLRSGLDSLHRRAREAQEQHGIVLVLRATEVL